MPTFKYTAIDGQGETVSGTITADGSQAAVTMLKEKGLFISDLSEMRSGGAAAPKAPRAARQAAPASRTRAPAAKKSSSFSFGSPVIKTKPLAAITRQLATLLNAGLPLLRSLRTIRDQQKGGPKMVLDGLATSVEEGAMLSQAMEKFPKSFPKIYIAMVRAGETSGALDVVLNRLAEFAEADIKLRGKIKSAMAYPSVILVVAVGIVSFIMISIVPVFVEMFQDFEAGELPGPTRALIFLSSFFTERLWVGILGLVILVIIYSILNRIPFTKHYVDLSKIRLPLFGPVVYKTIIARLSRTLATLITSGVPILTSFEIVEDTVGNMVISKAISSVHDAVREGAGIANPMIKTKAFPPIMTNMVGVGEETGALDEMLDRVAVSYEEEVDRAVEAMTSMIEPILIVFMGVVVGFIVVSLFIPLITMAMAIT